MGILIPAALTGKLHAAAGPSGPPRGFDEERSEEEGYGFPFNATGI